MDHAWNLHGPCMEFTWTMHGIYMDHAWNLPGPCMGVHGAPARDVLAVSRQV